MHLLRGPGLIRGLGLIASAAAGVALGADGPNLVRNSGFEEVGKTQASAADFEIKGDATRRFAGASFEISSMGVALISGQDQNGDGKREGSVSQLVPLKEVHPGRWYRLKMRGLPEEGFSLAGDDLHMKAEFLADQGKKPLDGVTRKIYPQILQDRKNIDVNGVRHKAGAAVWKTYAFEFRLPFPEIDAVRLTVGFRGGNGTGRASSFYVDDLSLEAIPTPADAPTATIRDVGPVAVDEKALVPLGGRWFYNPAKGEKVPSNGIGLVVEHVDADRLLYKDGKRYFNPFAENMTAWLKAGYLDLQGNLVDQDTFKPDNVKITFDGESVIVRAHNLPNHPTSKFPSPPGSGDRNPSYIQEKDATYRIPLDPKPNPNARAMDLHNDNGALPMGPIGFAVNGVVFFNPFDMGRQDATDLMDRCCGHPAPNYQYHYHKYPVCVKSPFADDGKDHSPVIGWAFDGFPVYGPYESGNVMAKDSKENPLNDFNIHQDPDRGWHYHVTPGKFPYIIGGYWGVLETRNRPRGGGGGMAGGPPGGRGPGGPGGPGMNRGPSPLITALDTDGDGLLTKEEIAKAPEILRKLDKDGNGELTPEELRPAPPRD